MSKMIQSRDRNKLLYIGTKVWLYILITIILLTDLAILLNIPFLRQIFGFLFLTILPGLLILRIFKLDKIDFLEKFILAWGLSISFLMLFGLIINFLSLSFGYLTPLSQISLLISFNIIFIVLATIGYKIDKEHSFFIPRLNLSTSEKAFLIVPVLFPALSIFGMNLMKFANNNIILMLLFFSISMYVVFVSFFNQKFSNRLYPIVIYLISISLLLLIPLKSNYIMGNDIHREYYLFRMIANNLHWSIISHNPLDACLSVSILPTIYQVILNISPEFLFKILYSLLYTVTPLGVYVISKKYVGDFYGFLASCFFMFQVSFFLIAMQPRTSIAIFFLMLSMMTIFNDRIDPLKKRFLFIVFLVSCIVSHYSTAFIFFFIILSAFLGTAILSMKYTFKRGISLTIAFLFFIMIFFWYSQVTETAFNAGVYYIHNTFTELNNFFVEESRGSGVESLLGKDIHTKGIPHQIEFVITWLTFAFIGIGLYTLIRRFKEMSFPELKLKKPDFLKAYFEVEYSMIALACAGILVITVALPYIAPAYGLGRTYSVAIVILSVFFLIGGITLSKRLLFIKQTFRKSLTKNPSLKEKPLPKKQKEERKGEMKEGIENSLQVWTYLIISLVLITYFLSSAGITYHMCGYPSRIIILDSEGSPRYDCFYTYDQEDYSAKWLKNNAEEKAYLFSYPLGWHVLISSGLISKDKLRIMSLEVTKPNQNPYIRNSYIYLRYYNVKGKAMMRSYDDVHPIETWRDIFINKKKIYNNGGSEIYR